jgi:hypothetical protein
LERLRHSDWGWRGRSLRSLPERWMQHISTTSTTRRLMLTGRPSYRSQIELPPTIGRRSFGHCKLCVIGGRRRRGNARISWSSGTLERARPRACRLDLVISKMRSKPRVDPGLKPRKTGIVCASGFSSAGKSLALVRFAMFSSHVLAQRSVLTGKPIARQLSLRCDLVGVTFDVWQLPRT